ncbi:MAG: ketopantoate reductase [Deltaproteobacteria bacterium]|nr:ketopantoate reductase [Deltaproteobacteria bacterium]
MKILLVGAGAVGQVYGYHLQKGGAEVAFLVREKYAAECRAGFPLYPLNRSHARDTALRFNAEILTKDEEVAARKWDHVHLCVSSTALRNGDWLPRLVRSIGDATLVMLQPGIDDRDHLLKLVPAERLVTGMISIISYHAPLPGEKVPEPGMAYWCPPLSPTLLSGPKAQEVVDAFKAGALPAKRSADATTAAAFPGAALMMLVAALELSDWSFSKLRHGEALALACDALKETCPILEKKLSAKAPFGIAHLRPVFLKLLSRVAPKVMPLDVETYFKMHFTKVGDQTRFMLRGYIDHGKELKLPVHRLEALLRKLPEPL